MDITHDLIKWDSIDLDTSLQKEFAVLDARLNEDEADLDSTYSDDSDTSSTSTSSSTGYLRLFTSTHLGSVQAKDFFVGTKYKPKSVKVQPVNAELANEFRTHITIPGYSRDPYATPLTPHPPEFLPTHRLSLENTASMFGPPGWLSGKERKLALHVVTLREKAIAFDPSQIGLRRLSYGPPSKLATVPHIPWQEKPYPLPPALRKAVIKLIRTQIKAGLIEPSQAAYASKWFVVMKKNGKIRFIFDARKLNSITVRDSGLPPNVKDYVNDMSERQCVGVIDLLLGYLQEPLNSRSCDLTTFRTPIGLYCLTRLPVGATNSVAVFQRLITAILKDEIPEVCLPFIDDIDI